MIDMIGFRPPRIFLSSLAGTLVSLVVTLPARVTLQVIQRMRPLCATPLSFDLKRVQPPSQRHKKDPGRRFRGLGHSRAHQCIHLQPTGPAWFSTVNFLAVRVLPSPLSETQIDPFFLFVFFYM